MTLSPARVGIDISKHGLDIHNATTRQTWRTANTADEIERLLKTLPPACVLVFEATAPYDRVLRLHASTSAMTVLRVNPTRARAYAFAAGSLAKTDAVDARVLAQLPATVANGPEPAFDAEREALASLHRRRDQMVETRAVERGRSRDVSDAAERGSLQRHITWLDGEIKALDGELQGMIAKPAFAKTAGLLRSVRGVGAVTAATVLALLPELGQLCQVDRSSRGPRADQPRQRDVPRPDAYRRRPQTRPPSPLYGSTFRHPRGTQAQAAL